MIHRDRLWEEMKEKIAKMHAELKESFHADSEQALDRINRSWNENMAMANENMTAMKDQVRKMDEENPELKDSFRAEREQAIDQINKSWK